MWRQELSFHTNILLLYMYSNFVIRVVGSPALWPCPCVWEGAEPQDDLQVGQGLPRLSLLAPAGSLS